MLVTKVVDAEILLSRTELTEARSGQTPINISSVVVYIQNGCFHRKIVEKQLHNAVELNHHNLSKLRGFIQESVYTHG